MYFSFFLKEGEEEKQTNKQPNKQTNKTRVYHNWDELVNMHDIYRPILRALIMKIMKTHKAVNIFNMKPKKCINFDILSRQNL